jgi:hypothetical protein
VCKGSITAVPFPKLDKSTLGLVYSDVCGKMNCEAKYFVTFIGMLKCKNQVFQQILQWKTLVEKSAGRKLKTTQTDKGGKFTSMHGV